MSQRKAYLDVFPNSAKWKEETVDNKAYQLFKRDEVKARYIELQEERAEQALLTQWEKRKILADMARSEDISESDRIKAIDLDNKMTFAYRSKLDVKEQKSRIKNLSTENNESDGGVTIINDAPK